MNELIAKIEQWAEDRNIIKGSKPIDQAMKLFSEFGELADNVGKGRDCRDDIGDVFVVLTIMSRQYGFAISNFFNFDSFDKLSENNKILVQYLAGDLTQFAFNEQLSVYVLQKILKTLSLIAYNNGYDLMECVQIAYDDIKDRKGLMHNGVFIKESDPAYAPVVAAIESNCTIDEDALDNIEADKRMATQKRISVNLEDL